MGGTHKDGGVDVLPEVPDDAAELLVEVVHVPVDLLIPHQSDDGTDSVSGGVEVRHRGVRMQIGGSSKLIHLYNERESSL